VTLSVFVLQAKEGSKLYPKKRKDASMKAARYQGPRLLCLLVIAALFSQCYCDVSHQTRKLQQMSTTEMVQVIDEEGNYVGEMEMSMHPASGYSLSSEELQGALQSEVAHAEVNQGKCRQFHAKTIPMFDNPSDISHTMSSVMVPVMGEVQSISVQVNLTHEKAGSAGLKLFYGDEPTDRPHLTLKDPCAPDESHCDHFGKNMQNVLFSDAAASSFPQDEMEAPFEGEYKPVQPLSLTKVGGGMDAGEGGTFGRWSLEAHIPGEETAPELEWTLQVCYTPEEEDVEAVLDNMAANGELEPVSTLTGQQAGARAAAFVRRLTGRMGNRIPARARPFMAYMGGLYVELAACYGLGEA
jgi:hypothetical protein